MYLTCNSLMATQESSGKPFSIGTRNWMQPDQWATKDMMQIRLKILANILANSPNCNKWTGLKIPVTRWWLPRSWMGILVTLAPKTGDILTNGQSASWHKPSWKSAWKRPKSLRTARVELGSEEGTHGREISRKREKNTHVVKQHWKTHWKYCKNSRRDWGSQITEDKYKFNFQDRDTEIEL